MSTDNSMHLSPKKTKKSKGIQNRGAASLSATFFCGLPRG